MTNNTDTHKVILDINGKGAERELETLKKRAEDWRDAMVKAAKEKGIDSKEYKTAAKEVAKVEAELRKMQKAQVDVNRVMSRLDKATPKDIQRAIREINKQLNDPAIVRGSAEWNRYTQQLRQAKTELAKIKAEQSATGGRNFFSRIFGGDSGFMNSVVGSFGKIAGAIGIGVGALQTFISVSRQTIKVNREFEQANANLASILGTSRKEIQELTADAKRLGASTQYTASQVTALQTELAKLGFTKAEILSSTEAVLNFATATGAGLADAASVAGAALRAFGLDASEMDRVASVMSVATTKSAMSFSTLQTSIGIVAPVAKQFGFSIEDTVALLGKLSDAGFDASSAATAVRNIFLYMSDPASKLSTALGGPIKSLDDLAPAFQKLTDRGIDLAEMLELTDKRAVSAFATLVSQGNGLTQLRDDITDCGDALKAMVDERMNTLEGSTRKLESAWEGLLLTFSNSTGVMKSVVDWLAKMVDGLHEFFASNDENSNTRVSERVRQLRDEKAWMAQYVQLRRELMEDEAMSEIEAEKEVSRQMREEYNKRSKEAAAVKARLDAINKRKDAGYGTYEENGKIYSFYEMNALQSQLEERLVILQNYADRASFIMSKADKSVEQSDAKNNSSGGGGDGGNKTNNVLAAQAKARGAKQLAALEAEYQKQRDAYKDNQEELQRLSEEYADRRYGIERGTLEEIRDIYKEKPQQYAQYNKQIFDLEAKHQRELAKIREQGANYQQQNVDENGDASGMDDLKARLQAQNSEMLAALEQEYQQQREAYKNNEEELQRIAEEYAYKRYSIERGTLEEIRDIYKDKPQQYAQYTNQILNLESKHQRELERIREQRANSQKRETVEDNINASSKDDLKARLQAQNSEQLAALETEYQQQREAYKNNQEKLQRIAEEYADKRYGIERGTIEEIRDIYADQPQQYALYSNKILDLEAKHQREKARIREQWANSQKRKTVEDNINASNKDDLKARLQSQNSEQLAALETEYQQQRELYEGNNTKLNQIAEEYADRRYSIERSTIEALRDLYADQPQQYAQYTRQIFDLEAKHQREVVRLREQGNSQQQKEKQRLDEQLSRSQKESSKGMSDMDAAKMRLAAKQLELREMMAAYKVYYDSILSSDALTNEQREQLQQEYAQKMQQISSTMVAWEEMNNQEKVKIIARTTGQCLQISSQMLSSIGSLMSARYDTEIAQVEKRYDAEIEAARNAGRSTTAIEDEKESAVNAIRKRQAQQQEKIDIAQALLNTAMSISQTLAQYGTTPWGIAMSAMAAALGAVQVATIREQARVKIAGYYEGGYTKGSRYKREAGVVHEGEFVANHEAVNNPAIRPMLDLIDEAQRQNRVGRITAEDIAMSNSYRNRGYAQGGYTSPVVNVASPMVNIPKNEELLGAIEYLNALLEMGIDAKVSITGKEGVNEKQKHYQNLISNKSRNL